MLISDIATKTISGARKVRTDQIHPRFISLRWWMKAARPVNTNDSTTKHIVLKMMMIMHSKAFINSSEVKSRYR